MKNTVWWKSICSHFRKKDFPITVVNIGRLWFMSRPYSLDNHLTTIGVNYGGIMQLALALMVGVAIRYEYSAVITWQLDRAGDSLSSGNRSTIALVSISIPRKGKTLKGPTVLSECSPTSKKSPLSDAGRVSPDGGTLAPAVALSWCWPPAQEDEDGRPAASAVARGCILLHCVCCRASPGEGGAPASIVSMVRCWLVDRGVLVRQGTLQHPVEGPGSGGLWALLRGPPRPIWRVEAPPLLFGRAWRSQAGIRERGLPDAAGDQQCAWAGCPRWPPVPPSIWRVAEGTEASGRPPACRRKWGRKWACPARPALHSGRQGGPEQHERAAGVLISARGQEVPGARTRSAYGAGTGGQRRLKQALRRPPRIPVPHMGQKHGDMAAPAPPQHVGAREDGKTAPSVCPGAPLRPGASHKIRISSKSEFISVLQYKKLWDLDFQMKCKMYFHLKTTPWTTEQQSSSFSPWP
ncbi:unnamed protein product, partial [Ranitomeya imitator]